jgi:hypothetical protein
MRRPGFIAGLGSAAALPFVAHGKAGSAELNLKSEAEHGVAFGKRGVHGRGLSVLRGRR